MKFTRTQPGLIPSQPAADLLLEGVRARPGRSRAAGARTGRRTSIRPATGCRTGRSAARPRSCGAGTPGRPPRRDRTTNDTIDSRSAAGLPRISMAGRLHHRSTARRSSASSRARITSVPDRLLELEDEPGADRLDDRRRAALLAVHRISPDSGARSGSRRRRCRRRNHSGTRLCSSSRRTTSTPGVPGPADELVRAEEHRVLVASRWCSAAERSISIVDVRAGGREVPERQRAVAVEQVGDSAGVGDDPGDVGGRRERPDLERPVGVRARELASRPARSMCPSASSGILTTSAIDSRQASSLEWCSKGPMNTTGRSVGGDVCRQLRTRSSRSAGMRRFRMPISLSIAPVDARTAEDHGDIVVGSPSHAADDPPRVLPQPRGLQPGPDDSVCVLA